MSDIWGHSKMHLQLFVLQTHAGLPEGIFQQVEEVPGSVFHGGSTQARGAPGSCNHTAFPTRVDSTLGQGWGPPPGTLILLFSVWSCFHLQGFFRVAFGILAGGGQTWGDPVPASIHTVEPGPRKPWVVWVCTFRK